MLPFSIYFSYVFVKTAINKFKSNTLANIKNTPKTITLKPE